ncbi:MAG: PQQ-binding-like beta-propeller repeat protein [Gemmatimonadota bacterium]|nr:PQQ-binding-like beta-propeller repeat protein [Gemmatimonadota bacterium]
MTPRHTVVTSAAAAIAALVTCTPSPAQEGEKLFADRCASCHTPAGTERAAGLSLLAQLSPRAIVAVLEDGVMRVEGSSMTAEQRIQVAEYLSKRSYLAEAIPEAALCTEPAWTGLDPTGISWMGFAGNLAGTGYQPPERAGLDASDVPNLELKWAFAFPDGANMRTSPAVGGDAALVAGPFGEVLALDLATGCVRWSFEADAMVRGAIVAGEGPEGRSTAWFVDARTNAYAVDLESGSLVWKHRVGWHAAAYGTGSPALQGGRLIVPISSLEVAVAGDPRYECCTSSGAVAALDAGTGEVLWYHRVIPGYPEETGKNGIGTTMWGPSGAAVWSSPTVDPARELVYVGTGENLTHPTTETSDAILALELETGEPVWSFQGTADDAFNMACTQLAYRDNCPDPPGPDLDFGMAPMLVTRPDGKEILVAGQKSGMVWAVDPDNDGALLWSALVGKGSALGGIHWGMASDGRYAYAPVADRDAVVVDVHPGKALSPGLYALDLMTGEVVWEAVPPAEACEGKKGCYSSISAGVTVIDGVVFAGGLDGVIRAHSTIDGAVIWAFDTTRPVETVGSVPGRGGAIDGPGPVVAGGMLFVNSGYGTFFQMPGNLLLAFGVGDPAGAGN